MQYLEIKMFNTSQEFSVYIEQTALTENQTCTETLIHYCDERGIEFEDISKMVSPSLKGKLHLEMIASGLLPEQSALEV